LGCAYTAEQRTKEVGIRKVLGATVSQVLVLLSKDFVLLVGLSCLIASPIAFYFLHQWLQGYYYRVSIGAGVFVYSALQHWDHAADDKFPGAESSIDEPYKKV